MHQNNHIPLLATHKLFKLITEKSRIQLERITRILLDPHRRQSGDFDTISRLLEQGGEMLEVLGHVESAVHDEY
ncbi:hypothetical protein KC332_g19171, partial [Hortaea werneckii]